jgi:glyoxylase-like metal-dependent hydrolase (beta-lactamase superfamily II)
MIIAFFSFAFTQTIHEAAMNGDLEKVKALLKEDPKLIEANNENKKTALHFAAQGGHKNIVEFLLKKGADINRNNIADETPIHYAAAMGHKDVVAFLIEKKAIYNSVTLNGDTPLHYAARFGRMEITRLLVELGGEINTQNNTEQNVLDLAFESGQENITQYLISKGGVYTPVMDPDVVMVKNNISRITFPYSQRSNIGVSMGQDGFLLVDTGFSLRAVDKLKLALQGLGNRTVKFIINTHLHADHIAGNSAGTEKTHIIDFNNLEKMVSDGILARTDTSNKNSTEYLGNTYYTLKFNGEEIRIIPYPGLHTEADMIIHFTKNNVIHMGDLLITESFPAAIGQVIGYMEFLNKIVDFFPEDTLFIGGHGRDFTMDELKDYQNMLLKTIDIVKTNMKAGKSVEQMSKDKVLKDFEKWNTFIPALDTNFWINAVYTSYKDKI